MPVGSQNHVSLMLEVVHVYEEHCLRINAVSAAGRFRAWDSTVKCIDHAPLTKLLRISAPADAPE